MRSALPVILFASLFSWGCGGGEFTSPGEIGGSSGDASVEGGGTGGDGGSGGTAGSGGDAGTGGGTACGVPSDCPGEDNECTVKGCENQLCNVTYLVANTPTTAQVIGDCKQNVCDGLGSITEVNDDLDVFDDNNPCTRDQCSSGTPVNPNLPVDTKCGDTLTCDGAGHCVGCLKDLDCGGEESCFTWHCDVGTCSRMLRQDGIECGTCRVCNTGACVNVSTGSDPNDQCEDVTPCGTDGSCNGGGACRFYPSTKPCGPAPSCSLGTATLQQYCSGNGGTCPTSGTISCSPYRCEGPACATSCEGALECVAGYSCTTGNTCVDCLLCDEWYKNPSLITLQACPNDSSALIEQLKTCACDTSGTTPCKSACAGVQDLCATIPSPPSPECMDCLANACANQLTACKADVVE